MSCPFWHSSAPSTPRHLVLSPPFHHLLPPIILLLQCRCLALFGILPRHQLQDTLREILVRIRCIGALLLLRSGQWIHKCQQRNHLILRALVQCVYSIFTSFFNLVNTLVAGPFFMPPISLIILLIIKSFSDDSNNAPSNKFFSLSLLCQSRKFVMTCGLSK